MFGEACSCLSAQQIVVLVVGDKLKKMWLQEIRNSKLQLSLSCEQYYRLSLFYCCRVPFCTECTGHFNVQSNIIVQMRGDANHVRRHCSLTPFELFFFFFLSLRNCVAIQNSLLKTLPGLISVKGHLVRHDSYILLTLSAPLP